MINNIFDRIKSFIIEKAHVEAWEVIKTASLQNDLGIYGNDAVEFFNAFSKEFSVDVSGFVLDDYFDAEASSDFMGVIFKLLPKKIQGNYPHRKKEFTVEHLIKAVQAGKLNEQVIAS
ncbi:MAG: DUF1493 family protein [Pseudobacter sp.]|uniref:DUF1493 family protein n=1 Tax=Pseudobacter sp. TaxID=2045420 RepID=UPI003F8066D6